MSALLIYGSLFIAGALLVLFVPRRKDRYDDPASPASTDEGNRNG